MISPNHFAREGNKAEPVIKRPFNPTATGVVFLNNRPSPRVPNAQFHCPNGLIYLAGAEVVAAPRTIPRAELRSDLNHA